MCYTFIRLHLCEYLPHQYGKGVHIIRLVHLVVDVHPLLRRDVCQGTSQVPGGAGCYVGMECSPFGHAKVCNL